jgi:hypothetical protein
MLHELLDLDYLISALLVGGLACRETRFIERFRFPCPDGVILRSLSSEVLKYQIFRVKFLPDPHPSHVENAASRRYPQHGARAHVRRSCENNQTNSDHPGRAREQC